MSDEKVGFRVVGVVQGVGFRWWTQRRGEAMGLRGVVTNRTDGSVEAHVMGRAEVVAAFERALRVGPERARVSEVVRVVSTLVIPDDGFVIQR